MTALRFHTTVPVMAQCHRHFQQHEDVTRDQFSAFIGALNTAFTNYAFEPLDRTEGGVAVVCRNGTAITTNKCGGTSEDMSVRFQWGRCWGGAYTSGFGPASPEHPPFHAPRRHGNKHQLHFKTVGCQPWTTDEMHLFNKTLVQALRWKPLRSAGYRALLQYYTPPDPPPCDHETEFTPKMQEVFESLNGWQRGRALRQLSSARARCRRTCGKACTRLSTGVTV